MLKFCVKVQENFRVQKKKLKESNTYLLVVANEIFVNSGVALDGSCTLKLVETIELLTPLPKENCTCLCGISL